MKVLVMAPLCLFFSAHAQSQKLVKPLRVGQMMPEMILHNIHNYKTTSCSGGELGFKFMIIQFWSGNSEACLSEYEKFEELACTYEWDAQFVRVTSETASQVLSSLLRHPPAVPSWIPLISDDKLLCQLFPHTQFPYYAWIDSKGKVVALTNSINEENIDLALDHKPLSISTLVLTRTADLH